MPVLTVRANATFRKIRIHLSSATCFGRIGHYQIESQHKWKSTPKWGGGGSSSQLMH